MKISTLEYPVMNFKINMIFNTYLKFGRCGFYILIISCIFAYY